MLERYKVLGAMLALKQFTVEELARFSTVNPTTVRTVLSRENKYLKELGRKATGQPGGRFTQYELEPRYVARLRSELQELFREVWATLDMQQHRDPEIIPLSLLAVEDALLHRYPNAKHRQERQHILNLSITGMGSGELQRLELTQNAEALPHRLALHLRLAKGLSHLVAGEFAAEAHAGPELAKLAEIWREVESCARNFHELGDTDLDDVIRRRLSESPVITREVEAAANEEYAVTADGLYLAGEADHFEVTEPSVNEASVEGATPRFLAGKW